MALVTLPWAPEGAWTRRTPIPAYGSRCLTSGIEGEGTACVSTRLCARPLGLVRVVVEGVDFDEGEQAVVVSVRPRKKLRGGPEGDEAPLWPLRQTLCRV